jgi:hypothetical protein
MNLHLHVLVIFIADTFHEIDSIVASWFDASWSTSKILTEVKRRGYLHQWNFKRGPKTSELCNFSTNSCRIFTEATSWIRQSDNAIPGYPRLKKWRENHSKHSTNEKKEGANLKLRTYALIKIDGRAIMFMFDDNARDCWISMNQYIIIHATFSLVVKNSLRDALSVSPRNENTLTEATYSRRGYKCDMVLSWTQIVSKFSSVFCM